MIEIICSEELYTYNIYHLTRAFFPSGKIVQRVVHDAPEAVCLRLDDGTKISAEGRLLPGHIDRRQRKYEIDRKIYHELESCTGRSLAWGLLTGVRPTKIAMQKKEEGMETEAFVRWFVSELLVSEEKARLAWEIAGREKELLDRLDYEDGFSLYVGIPFCPSVCTYCSFSSGSIAVWKDKVEDYLDALCRELVYIGKKSVNKKLNAIYIGGGTPTTLTAEQLKRLLCCIDDSFPRDNLLEYTVEAGRPDSITEDKLKVLYRHKVTRISVNPQSMQQKTLDLIGRKHTAEEIRKAYYMARETGFDNINMDLIAGLPGECQKDMEDTVKKIEGMAPDSLTVHSLAIKRAALLGQERSARGYIEALEGDAQKMAGTVSAMIGIAEQSAGRMGLYPYYLYRQKNIAGNFENVGYAKVDKAGIYNILIMEEKQSIIAAGAGASTKIVLKEPVTASGGRSDKKTNLVRIENVKAIDAYISRIDEMIERKGEWLWH